MGHMPNLAALGLDLNVVAFRNPEAWQADWYAHGVMPPYQTPQGAPYFGVAPLAPPHQHPFSSHIKPVQAQPLQTVQPAQPSHRAERAETEQEQSLADTDIVRYDETLQDGPVAETNQDDQPKQPPVGLTMQEEDVTGNDAEAPTKIQEPKVDQVQAAETSQGSKSDDLGVEVEGKTFLETLHNPIPEVPAEAKKAQSRSEKRPKAAAKKSAPMPPQSLRRQGLQIDSEKFKTKGFNRSMQINRQRTFSSKRFRKCLLI